MLQTIFGITVDTDRFPPDVHTRELIALLFASPGISVEQVERIVSDPSKVIFEKLNTKIREEISKLLEEQDKSIPDLKSMFSEKITAWSRRFGIINEEDIEFLYEKFHLKKEIFLEEIRKSLFYAIDSPKGMAEHVCRFIKGQNETVKSISTHFYNHQLRAKNKINPPKSSICLIGGTGVGKTETIKRFANMMNEPVISVNLGSVVPNGIVGTTIAEQIASHFNDSSDIDRYKYAVLHFSELDKMTKHFSNGLDYGIEIQKELLGFFEKDSSISLKRNNGNCRNESIIKLPANNLLICFDGAFTGIEKLIEKRLKKDHKNWK